MVNVIIMAMRYDNMPDTMAQVLYYGNIFFVALFTVEAILKIYGIGLYRYMQRGWNQFDFFLLLPAILAWLLLYCIGSTVIAAYCQNSKIVSFDQDVERFDSIVPDTVGRIASSDKCYDSSTLAFFIFAVIGMNLFASIRFNGGLNEHANFINVWKSMLLLFRMATGESYNEIMHNLRLQLCSRRKGTIVVL